MFRHLLGDQRGGGAFVKSVAPLVTHAREGCREIAQHQLLAGGVRLAVFVVRCQRCRVGGELVARTGQGGGQSRRNFKTVTRELHRRVNQLGPRHLAVFLVRVREAGHRTRYAHTLVRVMVNARRVGAGAVEEHLRRGAGRRFFAEVDSGGFAIGEADHHEAAAADVAGGRIGDRQREAGSDGGVDGIAAVGEHVAAGLAGDGAGRNHHTLRGVNGGAWGPGGGGFLGAEGEGEDGAGQPETGGDAGGQGRESHGSAGLGRRDPANLPFRPMPDYASRLPGNGDPGAGRKRRLRDEPGTPVAPLRASRRRAVHTV